MSEIIVSPYTEEEKWVIGVYARQNMLDYKDVYAWAKYGGVKAMDKIRTAVAVGELRRKFRGNGR